MENHVPQMILSCIIHLFTSSQHHSTALWAIQRDPPEKASCATSLPKGCIDPAAAPQSVWAFHLKIGISQSPLLTIFQILHYVLHTHTPFGTMLAPFRNRTVTPSISQWTASWWLPSAVSSAPLFSIAPSYGLCHHCVKESVCALLGLWARVQLLCGRPCCIHMLIMLWTAQYPGYNHTLYPTKCIFIILFMQCPTCSF